MIAKVISFPAGHFQREKQFPLTPLMISALLAACEKHKEGIPFWSHRHKGFFCLAYGRGLIVRKEVSTNEQANHYGKLCLKQLQC